MCRVPSPVFLALPTTLDSSSEAMLLALGNGSGWVLQAGVQVCLVGTCSEGWHKVLCGLQSSRSNLSCGRQRRYRQREVGGGTHTKQLHSLHYPSCRAAPGSPDDHTLDVQLHDQQADSTAPIRA